MPNRCTLSLFNSAPLFIFSSSYVKMLICLRDFRTEDGLTVAFDVLEMRKEDIFGHIAFLSQRNPGGNQRRVEEMRIVSRRRCEVLDSKISPPAMYLTPLYIYI